VSTNPVYQDEFVNFVRGAYGAGAAPVFFSLDNEPNYWGYTHPEVWPFTGTVPCQQSPTTYDDIVSRDALYGAAVKAAWPTTKVFGPVASQDGIIYAHSYASEVHAPTEFLDYYLGQMASASADAGTPLLDVLDVHYYTHGSSDPAQCVQNPRTFWDPNYTDILPTTLDNIDFGWSGLNNYFDTNWYPRIMIPRLLGKVAAAYASGGPGLSFSEYNSGCETTIAGGVAEADDLGIFGREGVFAAAAMPLATTANNYLLAAFDLYRNYDGNGAEVGDTAVGAATTDVGSSSVYAFAHSTDASKLEVVAINKATTSSSVDIAIAHAPALTTATAYQVVDGAASVVAATGGAASVSCASGTCSLQYVMPAMSATTIVLR
jgi:mannan endo-1,4-beta-mannosidase